MEAWVDVAAETTVDVVDWMMRGVELAADRYGVHGALALCLAPLPIFSVVALAARLFAGA